MSFSSPADVPPFNRGLVWPSARHRRAWRSRTLLLARGARGPGQGSARWKERRGLRTVESLLEELKTLFEAGLREAGEGIVARSPALVAARLLETPVAELEQAHQVYETPLSRTHALDFLSGRVAEERGHEVVGSTRGGSPGST